MEHVMMKESRIDVNVQRILWVIDVKEVLDFLIWNKSFNFEFFF
jgi:hypothetical protein